MTAPTTTPAAEQYLAEVEHELADLPADERAELLEDLAMHLAALQQEPDDRTLTERLGSSASYATELRSAAGLPPRASDSSGTRTRWLRTTAAAVRTSGAVRGLRSFLPQLRPAWWVLRGYLLVAVPSLWNIDGSRDFPVPAPAGSHLLGVILVSLAVVASVAVGRRQLSRFLALGVVAVNLVLLVGAANLLQDWAWRSADNRVVFVDARTDAFVDSPLITDRGPVTNILAFDVNGKPLQGVLLYDQDGRPLSTGVQKWFADHCRRVVAPPRAADGTPVSNSYPKPYVLDPEGMTLSGNPVQPGQCTASTAPHVVVPVFPKTAPSAGPAVSARPVAASPAPR